MTIRLLDWIDIMDLDWNGLSKNPLIFQISYEQTSNKKRKTCDYD
jgi:hypothetical protein